jgi:hypothetical protein
LLIYLTLFSVQEFLSVSLRADTFCRDSILTLTQ